jgi:hypothetical protein
MTRVRNIALALVAALIATFAIAGTASAEPLQWQITPQAHTGQINAATPYSLTNTSVGGGSIGYGHRTVGVDLRWGGAGKWMFMRPNARDHRAIGRGEKVALYNTAAHAYLGYAHETWGVNLVWWPTPSYEWQVAEGQDAGGNVRQEIYQSGAHESHGYLVYYEQGYGINLGFEQGLAPNLR